MTTSSEADYHEKQLCETSVSMSEELEKACSQQAHRFPQRVCLLQPADQWKTNALFERLQEAKRNTTGERIALFPYFVQQRHWIGIVLKFDSHEQVQRAEYFNPVTNSNFDSESLCQQFAAVYPSSTLLKSSGKHHANLQFSAQLTIDNLLAAARGYDCRTDGTWSEEKGTITSGNNQEQLGSVNDANIQSDCFLSERSFARVMEVPSTRRQNDLSGNTGIGAEYSALEAELTARLADNDIANEAALGERIEEKKREIESLEKANRPKDVQKRKNSLSQLEEIQALADKVNASAQKVILGTTRDTVVKGGYLVLKTELTARLADNDIANEAALEERIEEKKREIESLEKANRPKDVQKRKNSLSQLEEVQALADRMRLMEGNSNSAQNVNTSALGKIYSDATPMCAGGTSEKSNNSVPIRRGLAYSGDEENKVSSWKNEDTKESELIDSAETLNNLQSDLKIFPHCAEKHLLSLLFFTSIKVKMTSTSILADSNITIPQDIDTIMMHELESLQHRLDIEEIHIPWIRTTLSSCQIHFKSKHWEPTLTELRKIWKFLSPINMQELRRLVDRVDDAAKLIKDKDIILLIGGTGTGKSTTIHFLGGSTMIETKVKGMNHTAPTQIKNRDLQKIATAPSATSITRYIAPVTINLKDIGHRKNSTVILCDSPGFEDTSGPEVDIANGIGIVKAIKGCRSVKPVVLVSYKSIGDRCTGIKDLAHTLVGLMPGIQDHMKAFTYLFTKFSSKERDAINATLIDVEDHLNDDEKSDISFTSILEDMIKKTRNKAKAIDPVKDYPLDIIEDLLESTAILHPEEVFHFSVSEKSKSSVQEQVRADQLAIIVATKRSDHCSIQFKLNQLRYLYDLLQQGYIKQIYNDSITFVSKHLIEQYHTATTTFHRCVINQTTLSVNEIQQYQTSIIHAQGADELRTNHLTQDVPASSAYLQHLDQLIQTLSDDLKERSIDETTVKVSLDKIQILKTYFIQAQPTYEQTLELFNQKLHLVADHVKKSIFDNKFDETANNLKVLHGAISSLADHLDREKLVSVYKEQKNVLVKYLTDSTARFEHTFDKKLEDSDIADLNRCVCMFESAEKTFALHSHVSQESIQQIRKTLTSNILNHFSKIVNQIDTKIQEKADLTVMEQLMSELDAIRTIFGFDILTTQLYFSILEQLIGYINECRRDAEKQLDALFKQEPVDFTRLTNSLTALQGAKWIEKYRKGVYADLIGTVERRILEQIEQLIKVVMQTNLDLERTEKIEGVYRVIVRIDEMKRLNKFFSSINEQVDRVHTWFIKVTKDVFDSLTSAFTIEKWKEQGCLALDFNKAEKGLQYLFICKDIPLLFESCCASTLSSLEDFIRRFSAQIQNEIATHFEKIKHHRLPSEDDIHDRARVMAVRLNELSEIQTKCKLVFSYFHNQSIIEEWKASLSAYHIELQDEMSVMSRTGRVEDLNARLSIAKALSKLDSFIKDHQYIDLYKQYQDVFFSNTDEVCRKAIEAINKNDYDLVASEMAALQRADKIGEHFSKQARRAINFGVNTLIEEVKNKAIMLEHDVEREQIKAIVADLRRLQQAKQFISEYIDASRDIDECIQEVKILIANRMKRFLQGVRASITVNNFSEADRKIDSVTLVRNLLGVYCAEDVAKDISDLKEKQSDLVSNDLVSKYSKMDIGEYTLYPPTDIFAKFSEVKHTNPIYNEASNSIRDTILAKFRQELVNANSLQPPSSDNAHIRKFESAVKYLPKDMRESLEEELKHCKDDINKLFQYHNEKVKTTLEGGDLKAIKATLEGYQKSQGMQTYFNQVKEHILTKTKEVATKVHECFRNQDIVTALEHVKLMHDYQLEFQGFVTDIKQQCSDVRQHAKKVFEDAYLHFFSTFVEKDISIVPKDSVQIIERHFEDLFCFIKFSHKYRDLSNLSEMLPAEYHQKVASLHEKLASFFIRSEKQYREALPSLDISLLKNCLDARDLSSFLIPKIIKSYTTLYIYDNSTQDIIRAVEELTTFERMKEIVDATLEKLRDELMQQELINGETKALSKERDEFYARLDRKFISICTAKQLTRYSIKFDAAEAEKECLAALENRIQSISDAADQIFQQFMSDVALTRVDYDQFNLNYNNLVSCKEKMKTIKPSSTSRIEQFDKILEKKIQTWQATISQERRIDSRANILIAMKSSANNLPQFAARINQSIDLILTQIKSDRTNKTEFGKLGVLLNQDSTGVGPSIVAEHKAFQGYSLSLFNEKTQKHGINYVLERLRGDLVDINKLGKRYDEFLRNYEHLTKQYLKLNVDLAPLIATTKKLAGDVKQQKNKIEWDASVRNKVPQLTAHIFALWTLRNAHHYFDTTATDKKDSYLLKPHAAQVISIFRMLGIGDAKEELSNNMVQIGTGEGKSVTLGATSILLALLGFDVCCACYSEYLSDRDYISFLPLFTSLNVESYIRYGTFNKLCEYIINEDGDIRQVVEQLITKGQNQTVENAKQVKRAKILLIDEVDVFFSRDFYDNIYTPSASLRDPTIAALVNCIWRLRKTKITLKKVQETQEYKNCVARFPGWDALIREAIKDMIADVTSFESHNYVVKDDKIGYIEQDNIVFNVVYGYKTLFAYFLEHENNKISRKSLDEKISMTVKCGGYSYAEIPLQFQFIMGVTGTLETLSEAEQEVIKNVYNIKKRTISPSVFGQNNLQFTKKDDIRIETSEDYYNVIKREIDDRLRGRLDNRAVLVFFESENKLRDFYTSDAMKSIQETVTILTEEASSSEKESIIKRATASGQVTLFMKTFGRGTDFICYDPSVASNGGIHVIQTFLSEEVSEEVQIKGRTARQGDYGSYSMILREKDLEKFQISPDELKDVRDGKPVYARVFYKVTNAMRITDKYESIYDLLNDRRMFFFKTQYEANMQYVRAAKDRHNAGQEFLSNLKSDKTEIVKQFLIEQNKGAPEACSSRTICLMDATGSMTHLLQKSKNTVGVMFERAAVVLRENGISADCFQLQFVVYRNYCCRENKILQHSPWETKPDNLRAFMTTIDVEGGLGNEAIEIGFWYGNEENVREEITQIVLIGDAPPNTKAEVTEKRQLLGENYWEKTKFATAIYYEDELNRLKSSNIPVHAFYVADLAKTSFQRIAKETGGRCEFLDINSSSGSDMLTDLMTEEILRNVGGNEKGSRLVDAYRAKFARSYVCN